MMNDWKSFRDSFDERQIEAFWQYFIDHSTVKKTGFFSISFRVRDMDDFFKRTHARYTKQFSRYDKLERSEDMAAIEYWIMSKEAQRVQRGCDAIDKDGSLWGKIMLGLYRKTRDYIKRER